jgi:hypothetical protein
MAEVYSDVDEEVEANGKRSVKCLRRFRSADGTITPRSTLEVEAVIFEFPNGHKMVMELSELFPDGHLPEPSVGRAAVGAGINTSVGNVCGGIADIDEAIDAAESRWSVLTDGQWTAERKTGPRIGDLVDAWAKFRADRGADGSEAWKAEGRRILKAGLKTPKELLDMSALKAEYLAIKAKRSAERAEAARKVAGTSSQDTSSLLD